MTWLTNRSKTKVRTRLKRSYDFFPCREISQIQRHHCTERFSIHMRHDACMVLLSFFKSPHWWFDVRHGDNSSK